LAGKVSEASKNKKNENKKIIPKTSRHENYLLLLSGSSTL